MDEFSELTGRIRARLIKALTKTTQNKIEATELLANRGQQSYTDSTSKEEVEQFQTEMREIVVNYTELEAQLIRDLRKLRQQQESADQLSDDARTELDLLLSEDMQEL